MKEERERELTMVYPTIFRDAVSRDAVLDIIGRRKTDCNYDIPEMEEAIIKLPPFGHKGKWLRIGNLEKYVCSECHRIIDYNGIEPLLTQHYPYCHCGARMEENEVSE